MPIFDELDRKILAALQLNASLTHQELARLVQASAPTCQRRVKRLRDLGVISRIVGIVDPKQVGEPLLAIVEVSLTAQASEILDRFETLVGNLDGVQQCYRVSTGPDFILVLALRDMAHYQVFASANFTMANDVRNVRTFFCIKRSKFDTAIPIAI